MEQGDRISPFYDPMIAKLVAHSIDRETALGDLSTFLHLIKIWPVRSNAPFLKKAFDHDDFQDGEITTSFVDENGEDLILDPEPSDLHWDMAARVMLDPDEEDDERVAAGFRLNAEPRESVVLSYGGKARTLSRANLYREEAVLGWRDDEHVVIFHEGSYFEFALANRGAGYASVHDGDILAPMPGKVIAVDVAAGQPVEAGQRLLVLEAMKMEHALTAPFAGIVAELSAKEGQQVQVEALLARVEKAAE